MRPLVLFGSFFLLCSVWHGYAKQPNYIRTTIHNIDADSQNVVTTDYFDGHNRKIQSKQLLNGGRSKVVSTFFNAASQPYLTTRPFIDTSSNPFYSFTPGNFTAINKILDNNDNYRKYIKTGDTTAYAYYEIEYMNDPFNRIKRNSAPGADFKLGSGHHTGIWTFGIQLTDTIVIHLSVDSTSIDIKIVEGFVSAFITDTTSIPLSDEILDALYLYVIENPIEGTDHFLTVVRGSDGKFSQELKDAFDRTVKRCIGNETDKAVTRFYYDILGNLLEEEAPKGGTADLISNFKCKYNTLGLLIRKEKPDGAIEKMHYDNTGNLLRKETFFISGVNEVLYMTLEYNYDALSRLRSIKTPYLAGQSIILQEYFYDNVDSLKKYGAEFGIPPSIPGLLKNTNGRLVAEVACNRPAGELFYTGKPLYVVDLYSYDEQGRINTKYKIIPGMQLQMNSFMYDVHGKVIADTFKCGATISKKFYSYDEYGNLKTIAHANDTQVVESYKYDLLGRNDTSEFIKIAGTNSLRHSYNMQGWVDTSSFNGVNNFKQFLNYGDSTGTINSGKIRNSEIVYTQGAVAKTIVQKYTYDFLDRLYNVETTDKAGNGISAFNSNYRYDIAGRLTMKSEGISVNDRYEYYKSGTRATSRLKRAKTGGGLYIYDVNGNCIIDMSKKMYISYDWKDMPIKYSFYSSLPVGDIASIEKIRPDTCGTISINDSEYGSRDPSLYIDWLYEKGDLTLLSTVQILYDCAGKRVLKVAK